VTPVEEIRRATALMRERAEAVALGPWTYGANDEDEDEHLVFSAPHFYDDERGRYHGARWLATTGDEFMGDESASIAEHIASWHPAVALAVADWLDAEGRVFHRWSNSHHRGILGGYHYLCTCGRSYNDPDGDDFACPTEALALAVARAYLAGEQP
jgi:hypothetical protein